MAHFAPCHDDSTAEDIVQLFVERVFNPHGMPLQFVTDRGTEYCNKFADAVCKAVGTYHSKLTAYHPQTNGQSERMNRVLEDMLRHYVNPRQDDWDKLLPILEFAVNNSWNESIQNTPFYCNLASTPELQLISTCQLRTQLQTNMLRTLLRLSSLPKYVLRQLGRGKRHMLIACPLQSVVTMKWGIRCW